MLMDVIGVMDIVRVHSGFVHCCQNHFVIHGGVLGTMQVVQVQPIAQISIMDLYVTALDMKDILVGPKNVQGFRLIYVTPLIVVQVSVLVATNIVKGLEIVPQRPVVLGFLGVTPVGVREERSNAQIATALLVAEDHVQGMLSVQT